MEITYDPSNGSPISNSAGNLYTGQSYTEKGKLATYEADYNGNPIFQTSYERDLLGRITKLTEVNQGVTTVKQYAYDIAGRLWKVWRNDTLVSIYTYDANGNRLAHVTSTISDTGTYNAQDRMISYGRAQYLYSKNGELQAKINGSDTTRYTYDYLGNLIRVVLPSGQVIEYIIDGQNRRIAKKVDGVITKKWIYSGQLSPIAELDSVGRVVAHFNGSYMIKNDTTYQLIADHLGSIRMVVNVATGAIAQQIEYDEYGNILFDSNPDFQPLGYAGGLYDSKTKLVRFGARDYDPITGRWTCKDPIRFSGGQNLFVYASNDPINNMDISGLVCKKKKKGVSVKDEVKDQVRDNVLEAIGVPQSVMDSYAAASASYDLTEALLYGSTGNVVYCLMNFIMATSSTIGGGDLYPNISINAQNELLRQAAAEVKEQQRRENNPTPADASSTPTPDIENLPPSSMQYYENGHIYTVIP